MKKSLLLTVAAFVLVSESRIAVADSTDDAIRRLEAKIDTMAKENAALRTRLNRIEGTRATSTAHVAATSAAAVSAKQEPSNAMAASYPVKAGPAVAPPPPLWNWTGLYLGGHLGAGLSRNQFSEGTCTPNFFGVCRAIGTSSDLSHNGLGILGGVQVGYNWQFSNSPVVIGIEGTYSFADLKGDHQNSVSFFTSPFFDDLELGQERVASQTRGIATIVGRLGIASGPQDRTLWYVKGGAAWANTKLSANGSYSLSVLSDRFPIITSFDGASKRWGWTVGTGVEFGLFDNWSAKIEYDYLDFGTKDVALNGNACDIQTGDCVAVSRSVSLNQQIHMAIVGLNYRFNWWR